MLVKENPLTIETQRMAQIGDDFHLMYLWQAVGAQSVYHHILLNLQARYMAVIPII